MTARLRLTRRIRRGSQGRSTVSRLRGPVQQRLELIEDQLPGAAQAPPSRLLIEEAALLGSSRKEIWLVRRRVSLLTHVFRRGRAAGLLGSVILIANILMRPAFAAMGGVPQGAFSGRRLPRPSRRATITPG